MIIMPIVFCVNQDRQEIQGFPRNKKKGKLEATFYNSYFQPCEVGKAQNIIGLNIEPIAGPCHCQLLPLLCCRGSLLAAAVLPLFIHVPCSQQSLYALGHQKLNFFHAHLSPRSLSRDILVYILMFFQFLVTLKVLGKSFS